MHKTVPVDVPIGFVVCACCPNLLRDDPAYYHTCVACKAKVCPWIICQNHKMIADGKYFCLKCHIEENIM